MSVERRSYWVLLCDGEYCRAELRGERTMAEALGAAVKAQWRVEVWANGTLRAWCPICRGDHAAEVVRHEPVRRGASGRKAVLS